MKIDIYNQKGQVAKEIALPKEIFEVEFNGGLIHRALIRQLAHARSPIAHTLTKGEVRGGGRKPFRQKGTGRARQGSTRSPIMPGGGVVFGPRNVSSFEIQMPKKMRRKALFSALSQKAREKAIFGLDSYSDKDLKTKNFADLLAKLPVERNCLFVTTQKDSDFLRVTKNISQVKVIQAGYLNIHDLSKFRSICFVGDSIDKTKEIFTN
ncbi:50S ribosomal protein L4 [bacterium]|jgi:large subunit ribosomal protein L4|nr:50S ribosomal protein L4 [bacterium]